jgi:hypothetical protein
MALKEYVMFSIGLEQVAAHRKPQAIGSIVDGDVERREADGRIRCVSRSFRVIGETTLADYLLQAQLAGWGVSEQAKSGKFHFYRVIERPRWLDGPNLAQT